MVVYDRKTAARFNIAPQLIDNTLYDAFGQRQVSTMYTSLNQYHVVMEAAPEFWQNPQFLRQVFVSAPGGQQVPLSALASYQTETAPLTVTHQGLFPAVTISFNLAPNASLGQAVTAIESAANSIGLPKTIHTLFAGTAQAYQDSLGSEPLLIAAALITVYLVLGILYESVIHPDHDSLDDSLGRRRRVAGALSDSHRPYDHRHHRNHSADRHRQEERDHDDRFRPDGRA